MSDDLMFYEEKPLPAGVQSGYVVYQTGDGKAVEVADAALLHDGEGGGTLAVDNSTWRSGEITTDVCGEPE